MNSFNFRTQDNFLRNSFECGGKWEIPIVKKNDIKLDDVDLISYTDIKTNDSQGNRWKGVHFFIDDYRFEGIFNYPSRSLARLSQYEFLLTPDFSLYADMPLALQMSNLFKNRWCGAYWQRQGLKVIPTISWGLRQSFGFCFDGIEPGGIVSVGMIGCKSSRSKFLAGYNEMMERISPTTVICFGKPFVEMMGNLIVVDYLISRMEVH